MDLYSYCPCGSGKKIKWCCVDLLPQAGKIVRLLEAEQYTHAERALKQALREHPYHPLFLALALQAVIDHQCNLDLSDAELLNYAAALVRKRPFSAHAHECFATLLARTGLLSQIPAALQDYIEQAQRSGWPLHVQIFTGYLKHLFEDNPPDALAWLSFTDIGMVLRHLQSEHGVSDFLPLLDAVTSSLPGISNCPPYLPPGNRLTDDPSFAGRIDEAADCYKRFELRKAHQLLSAVAADLPEAHLLLALTDAAMGWRGTGSLLGLMVLVRDENRAKEIRMAAAIIATMCMGVYQGTYHALRFQPTREDGARELYRMIRQFVVPIGKVAPSGYLGVVRREWSKDGDLPLAGLVYWSEIGPEQVSWVVTGNYESARELIKPLIGREDYVVLPLFDRYERVLARTVADALRTGEETGVRAANAFLSYAKRELVLLPLVDLAGNCTEIRQAFALVLQRMYISSHGPVEKAGIWFEWFEVPPPKFALTKDSLAPPWLAVLDLERSNPESLANVVVLSGYPGHDIMADLLEWLQARFDQLDASLQEKFALAVASHVNEMQDRVAIIEPALQVLQRAERAGVVPTVLPRLCQAELALLRFMSEPTVQNSRDAANRIQLLVRDHAGNDLKSFVEYLVTAPMKLAGDKQCSNRVIACMGVLGSRILDLFLRIGLVRRIEKDWSRRELARAGVANVAQREESDEDEYLLDFGLLHHWLNSAATGVVVVPTGPPEHPKRELWTPDRTKDTAARRQEKKLWVPPS